jgi:dTDP-glucose 4,6-dehydratase
MAERAVVTGGAGFLGSHLRERLLTDSWEVVCPGPVNIGNPDEISVLDDGLKRTISWMRDVPRADG